ncbi:hypothetical protein SELMODRAFT_418316 [Selaginella moellendorffii]|uniref:Acyl-[acyl-carrier-protein] desaturase n=1 Tax=Selaginella moellendorffii TaxID=88036 RepID=D8S5B6_SELML|nr:hypothetical protein SELMODRAFT_418316 [Selaginella moellendorffii]
MELDLDGAHAWFFLLGCFLSPLCRKKAKSSTRFPTPPAAHRTKSGPTWGHPGSGVFLWRRRLQMGLVGNLQEGAAALVEVSLLQVQENGSLLHDEVLGIQAKCLEGLCRSGSSLSRMDCLDRANGGVLDQTSSSRRNVPSVRTPRLCLILVHSDVEFFDSGDGERLSRLCENFHRRLHAPTTRWNAERTQLCLVAFLSKMAQDCLPELSSESFYDEVRELRERAESLPNDYFFCLVGNMITEEALPTYWTMLNTLDGTRDEISASPISLPHWTSRLEANREDDPVLIGPGMDPQTENNPYLGFIYTFFQERATAISHGNTARHTTVCGLIAFDEKRHENAYTRIMEKLFEIDSEGAMLGLEDMMRKKISMPAHLVYDGQDKNLFEHFSLVAQRMGVYIAKDYAGILEHLVKRWNIESITGLSARAQKAQNFVCGLPQILRLEERAQSRVKKGPNTGTFSWIFNREVVL